MRRLALKSVLSQKVLDESLVVVDEFKFETPKTKDFAQSLSKLNVEKKALLVLEEDNESAELAARNLSNVKIVEPTGINVLDIMNSDKLVITQKALSQVEEALA